MQKQLIIILLVALALILVTIQNPNPVSLQFLSWQAQQVPLIIIILLSLLVGMVISSVLGLVKQSKMKETIRRMEREIDELKHPAVVSYDEDEKLKD
ncbi:MAG TPA: LapA family protein [Sedimentisphaerales bacterium]|nr:LapA family protein [Sedimentisphaerales bacterium]